MDYEYFIGEDDADQAINALQAEFFAALAEDPEYDTTITNNVDDLVALLTNTDDDELSPEDNTFVKGWDACAEFVKESMNNSGPDDGLLDFDTAYNLAWDLYDIGYQTAAKRYWEAGTKHGEALASLDTIYDRLVAMLPKFDDKWIAMTQVAWLEAWTEAVRLESGL